MQSDGLWCALCDWSMGSAAEYIGEQFEISREAMDRFALRSHQLAAKATDEGHFQSEFAPVIIQGRKGETVIQHDESIRHDTTLEALTKLPPAFKLDGSVTAGNAPGMTDGAAAIVVSSREYAEQHQHQPIARIVGYAQAAVEPKSLFYAPVKAIPLALQRAGWSISDVDLFELNEAFAAQVLADIEGLKRLGHQLPMEKLNINGGAIALGHPLGASGARVLITLVHALQSNGLKRGLAALCLGGGEAVALAVELEIIKPRMETSSEFSICGKVKMNVVPVSGWLSTRIVPPCASTNPRTIANPRPVPRRPSLVCARDCSPR